MASVTGTASRIRAHYYDRIYFLMGVWYGPDIYEEIRKNYTAQAVIRHELHDSSSPYGQLAYGSQPQLVEDCQILVPKPGFRGGFIRHERSGSLLKAARWHCRFDFSDQFLPHCGEPPSRRRRSQ